MDRRTAKQGRNYSGVDYGVHETRMVVWDVLFPSYPVDAYDGAIVQDVNVKPDGQLNDVYDM
jgi:hypothetical protein